MSRICRVLKVDIIGSYGVLFLRICGVAFYVLRSYSSTQMLAVQLEFVYVILQAKSDSFIRCVMTV